MYHEIDLHHMNSDDALRIFIQKYNKFHKMGDGKEIRVIHGYGSGVLDGSSVISEKLRGYLSRNRDCVKVRLELNPGVTYVTPIKPLTIPVKNKKKR